MKFTVITATVRKFNLLKGHGLIKSKFNCIDFTIKWVINGQ